MWVVTGRRDRSSSDIWPGPNVLRGLLDVRASSPRSAVLWLHIDHNTALSGFGVETASSPRRSSWRPVATGDNRPVPERSPTCGRTARTGHHQLSRRALNAFQTEDDDIIEYTDEGFAVACDSVGDGVSVVLRDVLVTAPGSDTYMYDSC